MYAIIDVADKQFKVRPGDTLYVPHRPEAAVDDTLAFDRVLLASSGDSEITLGTPTVEAATVTARVLEHVQGDKITVFKKKRRKRYKVKRGHRQKYTQIKIEALSVNGEQGVSGEKQQKEQPDEAPQAEEQEEETPTLASLEATEE